MTNEVSFSVGSANESATVIFFPHGYWTRVGIQYSHFLSQEKRDEIARIHQELGNLMTQLHKVIDTP